MGRREEPYNGLKELAVENYYLLVIGIDYYAGGFPKLSNAVRDAGRVANVLTTDYTFHKPATANDLRYTDPDDRYCDVTKFKEAIHVYKSFQTTCLYNEEASRDNISQNIKAVNAKLGPNDAFLIYFAGHGIHYSEDDEYYLITSESEQNKSTTWTSVNELTRFFKDYPKSQKCRNFLLVLDCCYAGTSMLGFNLREAENFSRYVLTSCKYEEEASDGIVGDGSPFARTFEGVLNDNSNAYMLFDEQKFGVLQSRFEQLHESNKQRLAFGFAPGCKNGQGYFLFEKREKDKPKPEHLRTLLIDELDFEEHRGSLKVLYQASRNQLNIITTQGYSYTIQQVLSKIVFRWLAEKKKGAIPFEKPACFIHNATKIDMDASLPIWQILYNSIKKIGETIQEAEETVYYYFFEKLFVEENSLYGKRHVIVKLNFELGSTENFERIQDFCHAFSTFFLNRYDSISKEEKEKMGKMFIIFSHERLNDRGYRKEMFTKLSNIDKFNLITLQPVSCINNNHIDEWVEKAVASNLSTKIQQLKDPKIFWKFMSLEEGCVEFTCNYEDFVNKLNGHCAYNAEEQNEVTEYLFDFKMSLI